LSCDLSRCCLIQAIHDRLKTLESRPEEVVTNMLRVSNVMNESQRVRHLSGVLKRERDYLTDLGARLGQCAEKLVCVALQDARRMASRPTSSATSETTYQWAYFVSALNPTLNHTEIESKVSRAMTICVLRQFDFCF
jgi:hypothetical protein